MGAQWRQSPEQDQESPAPSIHDRARENLEFIRSTMSNSASFTGVPGLGMMAMGCIALAGGFAATRQDNWERWLWCWTMVAFAGCGVGVAAMLVKAHLRNRSLWEGSARRFLLNFSPAIVAGAVLGEAYFEMQPSYAAGGDSFMPALWLMLYGAAVISGGAFSVKPVSIMGVCFMAAGVLTIFLPTDPLPIAGVVRPYDVVLAVSFGGLHLVFGALIALRHGG